MLIGQPAYMTELSYRTMLAQGRTRDLPDGGAA
jgi:hypothetical protein